ncbi:hypothetical protein EHM76_00260 [bacterium]|nr:MAG: hypothetical protein EHM76_00260 [bacterium]
MKKRRPDHLKLSRFIRTTRELVRAIEEYHGEKFTREDFELVDEMLQALPEEDFTRARFMLIFDEAFCRNHGKEPGLKPEWFMH